MRRRSSLVEDSGIALGDFDSSCRVNGRRNWGEGAKGTDYPLEKAEWWSFCDPRLLELHRWSVFLQEFISGLFGSEH